MLLKKHINLLLFTLLLGACNSVDRLHEYPITDDYILVDMNISAAIEQSDIPIPSSRNLHTSSSGLPDGVFAVNILYKGKAINNYQPYAAGLYDNPYSSMQIKLIAGYEYRFDCSFLSFSDISIVDQSNDTCFYGKPFALTTSESLPAYPTNKLLVSQPPYDNKTPYYSGIYKGASQVSVDSVSIRPSLYRYYGSKGLDLRNNTPDRVSISIELQRAYYFLQFISNNIPAGDRIRITLEDNNYPFFLNGTGGEDDIKSSPRLFTLKTVAYGSGAIATTDAVNIQVDYFSLQINDWKPLFRNEQTISLKRNKINVVRLIDVSDPNMDADITLGEGEFGGIPTDSEEIVLDFSINK